MVDPLKYSYYLVLVTEKKKKYDITNFVEDLGWEELENELDGYINEIQDLIVDDKPPEILNSSKCKKCAYYEYCYI